MKDKFAKLINVKTLVTIALVGVFAYLAVKGGTIPTEVTTIVTTVTAFYFGTQHEKKEG